MTRDDITRMAREAGCVARRHPEYWDDVQVFATPDVLEHFAALVAAAEREACAKVCEDQYEYYGHDHIFAKAIRARGQA